MTVMALNHKLLTIHDINKNEKRWAHPAELGGSFIQEFVPSPVPLPPFPPSLKPTLSDLSHISTYRIRGQTFGILGYGHLGREIARLASAFGARIIACTREGAPKPIGGFILSGTGDREGTLPSAYFKTGDEASLHAFLGEADVVVNALPASAETRKFLGRREFEAMKGDAIVVNVRIGGFSFCSVTRRRSGGELTTLRIGCRSGAERRWTKKRSSRPFKPRVSEMERQESSSFVVRSSSAYLFGRLAFHAARIELTRPVSSVTDPEPLPPNHILFSMDNVILTPHVSWASKGASFPLRPLLWSSD